MAKRQKDHQRMKQQKQAHRKRRNKQAASRGSILQEPSNKVARKLAQCYELIEEGYLEEAERILDHLIIRNSRVPAVIETQVMLYQEMGDHEVCCSAAKRLLELTPRDPEALMLYAQESLLCGRATIALLRYREYLRRFPDHQNVSRAQKAIKICEDECQNRIEKARAAGYFDIGFDDGGLELYAMHEDSLAELRNGHFENAIGLCQQVLETAPHFLSARNNLASCYFQSGEPQKAVMLARETCKLAPENRYAEANLIKLNFLTGHSEQANQLADRLVADPPSEQDSICAATETLSFLGRDQDVIDVAGDGAENRKFDPNIRGVISHYLAAAHFRMGDEKAARRHWKKCLQLMHHPEALANLDDLEAGTGHAPWAESIGKWLPQAVLKKALSGKTDSEFRLLEQVPALKTLVPALLDRGDPTGREFALGLATINLTPELVESLRKFGTSDRGPTEMRYRALITLYQEGHCGAGPHRFFSHGQWTEVQLFCPEITEEPLHKVPAWQQKLGEQGNDAMHSGDYDKAEIAYQEILKRDPDAFSAEFNLATVWLRRDGEEGQIRAEQVISRLSQDHPDYKHAKIAMAQFASMRNDPEEAGRLLGEVVQHRKFHISEATALFATQAQIALHQKNIAAAESALEMLVDLMGKDHPVAVQIRDKIELTTMRRSRFGLNLLNNYL